METTGDQRRRLATDGYVLLPGAVEPALVARWRELAVRLEHDAVAGHVRSEPVPGACVVDTADGPRLIRYDDVLGADPDATLDLLSSPGLMAVARELCGRGCVPLQTDLMFKHIGPVAVIPWHQGAPHPRGHPYLNVGVYLDDADPGDGCLRYVPGTQHEVLDICAVSAHGWDPPGVVEQPARAGDVLVQDMMVLHGSQVRREPGVRRTIYIELRPVAGIAESGAQTERWAELRRRWMALVVRRAAPGDWPAPWRDDLPTDLGSDADEIAAILARHEPPIPSVYCSHDVTTGDYPLPT